MATKPFDVGARSDAEERKQKSQEKGGKGVAKKAGKKEVTKGKEAGKEQITKAVRPIGEKYELGGAPYNPRVEHNEVAWDNIRKSIKDNGGISTHKQLCEVLKNHHSKTGEHHQDFIGYMVRRGSLSVVK